MKLLIVGHPDDEILWFNPENFDKIIIVFFARSGNDKFNHGRQAALLEHPLRHKIIRLNFLEAGLTQHSRKDKAVAVKRYFSNYHKLMKILPDYIEDADEIFSHNQWGEYGHPEHVLINNVLSKIATHIPVYCLGNLVGENKLFTMPKEETMNTPLFEEIKAIYKKYGVWTFREDYQLPTIMRYYKEEIDPENPRITNIII
jgi:hypothetical protein